MQRTTVDEILLGDGQSPNNCDMVFGIVRLKDNKLAIFAGKLLNIIMADRTVLPTGKTEANDISAFCHLEYRQELGIPIVLNDINDGNENKPVRGILVPIERTFSTMEAAENGLAKLRPTLKRPALLGNRLRKEGVEP